MERTMQWWDEADDLWFAIRLRLIGLLHFEPTLRRALVPIGAVIFLLMPVAQAA